MSNLIWEEIVHYILKFYIYIMLAFQKVLFLAMYYKITRIL